MAGDKYFLRRDMEHGLTVFVGEEKESGPYAAVTTIRGPRGHILLLMGQDGRFAVEIHPEGGDPVEILGIIDLLFVAVDSVGGQKLGYKQSGPKPN